MAFHWESRRRAVLIDGENWHDLAAASNGSGPDGSRPPSRRTAHHPLSRSPEGEVASAAFGPPVPCPRSVFAIGLNYAGHAGEADMDLLESPLVHKVPSVWPSHRQRRAQILLTTRPNSLCRSAQWAQHFSEQRLNHVMGSVGQDIPTEPCNSPQPPR